MLILTASREPPTEAGQVRSLCSSCLNSIDRRPPKQSRRGVPTSIRSRPIKFWSCRVAIRCSSKSWCHKTVQNGDSSVDNCSDNCPAWLSTLIDSRVENLRLLTTLTWSIWPLSLGRWIQCALLRELTGAPNNPILQDLPTSPHLPGGGRGHAAFKHGITRDVIYASVGLGDWEMLHRRMEIFWRPGPPSWVGFAPRAALVPFPLRRAPDRAAHYAESAGNRALAAAAPDRARNKYTAALTALDSLPSSDATYARWSRIVIGSAWPVCSIRRGIGCRFSIVRRPCN